MSGTSNSSCPSLTCTHKIKHHDPHCDANKTECSIMYSQFVLRRLYQRLICSIRLLHQSLVLKNFTNNYFQERKLLKITLKNTSYSYTNNCCILKQTTNTRVANPTRMLGTKRCRKILRNWNQLYLKWLSTMDCFRLNCITTHDMEGTTSETTS